MWSRGRNVSVCLSQVVGLTTLLRTESAKHTMYNHRNNVVRHPFTSGCANGGGAVVFSAGDNL